MGGPNFFNFLPDEILFSIFGRLETKDLENLNKSCRRFRRILNLDDFWLRKGHFSIFPSKFWRTTARRNGWKFDFRRMVISGRGYSKIQLNLGDSLPEIVKSEIKTANFHVIPEGDGIKQLNDKNGIAFSNRHQQIDYFVDLVASGIDTWILDSIRPKIRISQKISRSFNGIERETYCSIGARLGNSKNEWNRYFIWRNSKICKKIEVQWYDYEEPKAIPWSEVTIDLEDYPPGMRHLLIQNSGGGGGKYPFPAHRGPQFADLTVQIILPEENANF